MSKLVLVKNNVKLYIVKGERHTFKVQGLGFTSFTSDIKVAMKKFNARASARKLKLVPK